MTFSQGAAKDKSQPIVEIDTELVLKGMNLSYEQFVDLCIMCGCDYCGTIKGIGPKSALKLIREFKTIEAVVVRDCLVLSCHVRGLIVCSCLELWLFLYNDVFIFYI